MISKQTIFSLLLAVLLGLAIRAWAIAHRDSCDMLQAGKSGTPMSVNVMSGTRMVTMPCSVWVIRQPLAVQGWWLADVAVWVVFLFTLCGDWLRWLERRKAERRW